MKSAASWALTRRTRCTAALLFECGKRLFSLYLQHAGTASMFGAAGSLVIILMWLYYSAAVFLLGAELAAPAPASARTGNPAGDECARRCGSSPLHGKYTARVPGNRRIRHSQEHALRRTAENKLKVVAVRVDPAIEQRLRLLAEVTGRKQSFFLQRMIEEGIESMEEIWLSSEQREQARGESLQPRTPSSETTDLFSELAMLDDD